MKKLIALAIVAFVAWLFSDVIATEIRNRRKPHGPTNVVWPPPTARQPSGSDQAPAAVRP